MNTGSRLIVYFITDGAKALAEKIAADMPEAESLKYLSDAVKRDWPSARAMVFIMASGIAVRTVAPLLKDKKLDPALLVMDDRGAHVVSLAGGHEAGANALARDIARIVGATPVITTGTDSGGLSSIDVFANKHALTIENREHLPAVSANHIRQGYLNVHNDSELAGLPGFTLPEDLHKVEDVSGADVIISSHIHDNKTLMLRPQEIYLGMGVNSGTSAREIESAVVRLFKEEKLSPLSLAAIATHEKKKRLEPGLREFAAKMGVELIGFTTEELNAVKGVEESPHARKALGVQAVAEPAALLASGSGELLAKKKKDGNVTLSLCRAFRGKLKVVGTGPGVLEYITPQAMKAIREADVVVGFKSYLDLIEPLLGGKEIISSAMTQEVKRVRRSVELAAEGRRVALISGGDPGVYAMAGLAFEVAHSINSMGSTVDVEVIPGLSALNACAARLGAPLMHDFTAISLSDRLTPWEVIASRLEAAASADFVIVLYNPKSKGRTTQIARAQEIILGHRAPETPVGIVRSAMREDEDIMVTSLGQMLEHEIGMRSTVVIGNSKSYRWRDRIVTPRGYGEKYEI